MAAVCAYLCWTQSNFLLVNWFCTVRRFIKLLVLPALASTTFFAYIALRTTGINSNKIEPHFWLRWHFLSGSQTLLTPTQSEREPPSVGITTRHAWLHTTIACNVIIKWSSARNWSQGTETWHRKGRHVSILGTTGAFWSLPQNKRSSVSSQPLPG